MTAAVALAAVMALGPLVGGYIGARPSRMMVRTDLQQPFVTAVGVAMVLAVVLR
ncbi:hypothetical protein [Puniceibacterium confluentis]|uniref:hypothetical protein n=1 Tax=Puniceibacterium confluentis TaxID=1958944 RepID=UPI0016445B8E|nr:hypothetical protein [Puniceibacterium confluentis]